MTKNNSTVLPSFSGMNVMVIGDVMLDSYLWGSVSRISPEAPVPIVAVEKKEKRPGGAANVALNVQALEGNPILCTVTGRDQHSAEFVALMEKLKMNTAGIVQSTERKTTVKTRVIGNRHQLLRVDEEDDQTLSGKETEQLLSVISKLMNSSAPDVIIFEDYDKGVLHPELIKAIVSLANGKNIPVAVDPKKRNFLHYRDVTLFKPNLHELKTGLKADVEEITAEQLEKLASVFRKEKNIGMLLVTLSEHGIFYSAKNEHGIIPAHEREVADVSGAGDTVATVAAMCLAAGMSARRIATLSNLAGGLVCEHIGVVPVEKSQLDKEALKLNIDWGIAGKPKQTA